jgi:hypothetical protein
MSCHLALYLVNTLGERTDRRLLSVERVEEAVDAILEDGVWTSEEDIKAIKKETVTIERETKQFTERTTKGVVIILAPSRTNTLQRSATYPLDTLITGLYSHLDNISIWVDGTDYSPDED